MTRAGSTPSAPQSTDALPPAVRNGLDALLQRLRHGARTWNLTDLTARTELLAELRASVHATGPAWVEVATAWKGSARDPHLTAEEWGLGVFPVVRQLGLLERTLRQVQVHGAPRPPRVRSGDGRRIVDLTPADPLDRLLLPAGRAEVWLQPGLEPSAVTAGVSRALPAGPTGPGEVALVLGAGNLSSIGPMDALHQVFVEGRAALLKLHPVTAPLAPVLEQALAPLLERDLLGIVAGDGQVGAYLTDHDEVDTIHLTGGIQTHDRIVFGDGAASRTTKGAPRLTIPVTSELGNVSPWIVVPGPWSPADTAYQATALASALAVNAGFTCVTPRVVVQHRSWAGRQRLLEALRACLRELPPREPYYPGARDRHAALIGPHPTAEHFGQGDDAGLPFTLLPDLDPNAEEDGCFTTEAFCGLLGEVALDSARSIPDYLDEAVAFCNDRLHGNLSATLVVHPRSLADPEVAEAVRRAVATLRYGTVGVNLWAGVSYLLVSPPWGAAPGNPLEDVQSGRGFVHNTFLLDGVERTVLTGPFRQRPAPAWFHTQRRPDRLYRLAADLAARPRPATAARLAWHGLTG